MLGGCGSKITEDNDDLCMNPNYVQFGYIKNLREDIEAHTLPAHFIEGFYSGKTSDFDKQTFQQHGITNYKTCHYEATKGRSKGDRATIKIFEYDGDVYVIGDYPMVVDIVEMDKEKRERYIFE